MARQLDRQNTPEFLERKVVGQLEFTDEESALVDELACNLRKTGFAFGVVGVASIFLTYVEVLLEGPEVSLLEAPFIIFKDLAVGDFASWTDSLLVSYLLYFAAKSFQLSVDTPNKGLQLAYAFQGVNRLGLLFQQFTIAAITLGFIDTLEAAEKWPPIVSSASALFFVLAIIRSASMWYVVDKYAARMDALENTMDAFRACELQAARTELPLLDRAAIAISFSNLLQYLPGDYKSAVTEVDAACATVCSDVREYEFSTGEENLLNLCINAANNAGLALVLQAFASGLLVVACVAEHEYSDAAADGINVVNKLVAATVIYTASQRFDLALHTVGSDVAHFMYGLGSNGLTKLFKSLQVLAWAVALAKVSATLAPVLHESPVYSFLAEKFSHRAVDLALEVEELVVSAIK